MNYKDEWELLREKIVWRKIEFSNAIDSYDRGRFDSYDSLLDYITVREEISENQEIEVKT